MKTPLRSISSLASCQTPSRNSNFKNGKIAEGDRYIALRLDDQRELASHLLSKESEMFGALNNSSSCPTSPASKLERQTKLNLMRVNSEAENLGVGEDRVCAFRKGFAPIAQFGYHQKKVNVLYTSMNPSSCSKKRWRHINKDPERMLDAPSYRDDYYFNLLDWSNSNIVAVALGQKVFAWHASTGVVEEVADFSNQGSIEGAYPTVVKWSTEGCFLAIGFSDGRVQIFDVAAKKALRKFRSADASRVVCASWGKKGQLCFGSRTGRIFNHDVTIRDSLISGFDSHTREVCGIKWSPDERYLASGGADAIANVWHSNQLSTENAQPYWTFNGHVASIKSIEYGGITPNTMATGGGLLDNSVKFWNLLDGSCQYSVDTQSQAFGEMITAHGVPRAGVRLWKFDATKIKKYEPIGGLNVGDTNRVLALSSSPCGEHIIAACQDEVIRLWDVWKLDESMLEKQGGRESVTASAHRKQQLNKTESIR